MSNSSNFFKILFDSLQLPCSISDQSLLHGKTSFFSICLLHQIVITTSSTPVLIVSTFSLFASWFKCAKQHIFALLPAVTTGSSYTRLANQTLISPLAFSSINISTRIRFLTNQIQLRVSVLSAIRRTSMTGTKSESLGESIME